MATDTPLSDFWVVKPGTEGPLKFYIVSMVNGCGTHSFRISVISYVAVLKHYRAEFKVDSVSVCVNKA